MKKNKTGLIALGLAGAVAGTLFTQAASADTLVYQGSAYGFANTTGVVANPAAITSTPKAGGFIMDNTTVNLPGDSFLAWCLDVQGWLSTTANYTLVTAAQFYPTNPDGAVKISALERLATAKLFEVNTKLESGAFQLAVWEIVNEVSGPYSLGSGSFMVGTATATTTNDVYNLAQSWLTNINDNTFSADNSTLSVWRDVNGVTQDLAVFAPAPPIPEPEVYAMLGLGLGLMGFVARRRKQNGIA